MVGRVAALEGVGPGMEAQHPQVRSRDLRGAAVDHLTDLLGLGLRGQVHPSGRQLGDGLLAAGPGEDEDNCWEEMSLLQGVDDGQA